MLNFLNKRKREIERLKYIIVESNVEIEKYKSILYNIDTRKSELERELKVANSTIHSLQNEVNYLKMRIENTKGEVNSRYY